ncbi:V-type ATP synthase subunit I [Dethiosulfovibrio salsuginis]|uniref:V/A-type H+-transporting ATPase subunit I n=1 Tax=Dethiosulfovibrio salsuginis TaxID=561720 RepID=A0A1X7I6J2_9BACT|nr:V-type ATP synthase subunit I [Dethiosulfovibrio salsuginis]SMG10129.1 V/A-type H+-transporting ATPase subunit I [Dethiosulfovibrio salsuginis]
MGVASVSKLELYAHNTVVDAVLAELQKLGCCEVFVPEDSGEVADSLPGIADLDEKISEARYLLRILEPYYIDPVGSMARSFGERPEFSLKEMKCLSDSYDVIAKAEEIRGLERRLVEIRSEISKIDGYLALLSTLDGLPYPLSLISSGTEQVFGALGTLSVDSLGKWKGDLNKAFGADLELYVAPYGEKDKEATVVFVGLRSIESEVLRLSAGMGFSKVDISEDLSLEVAEEISRLSGLKEDLILKVSDIEKDMGDRAGDLVPDVRVLGDYWGIMSERLRSSEQGERTDEVTLLRYWVPESDIQNVKKSLSRWGGLTELRFTEPSEEDDPPSLLSNPEWSLPFETLTKLYGAPTYGGPDPTPLLAPFFFLFFGMCLGDGGYGLIMVAFFLFFFKKYKKMPSGAKSFFSLFVLSGIAATLVGALTGSWMGDMVDVVPFLGFLKPLKDIPVLLVPMDDPMAFLGISLVFGVFQIFFGMAIAMRECLKKGDYMGAFADQLGWMVFLSGLLLLGASTKVPSISWLGKLVTFAGAATLIATQGRSKDGFIQKAISGLLSLYNVTSYLGDVLSYSRLLALGLATSAIAMIINMLAGLSSSIPYVGWIIAIVLFLGGHLFSVAVNVLGAFVHSLRLQYVEFFSKFYAGGGRLFEPLRYNTKYVAVSEDGCER